MSEHQPNNVSILHNTMRQDNMYDYEKVRALANLNRNLTLDDLNWLEEQARKICKVRNVPYITH